MKTSKQLERYFKGPANKTRIDILVLVSKKENITLDDIASNLDRNFRTISDHTKKLVQAGLLNKSNSGVFVMHSLSPYGIKFVKFLQTF